MDTRHQEFLRFCVVGAVCTALDMALFYLLRIIMPYQAALVGGYVISLVVNYMLTIRWTFRTRSTIGNAIGIVSAHLFNLFVVRMGLMYLFTSVARLSDDVAFIPTLIISVVTNFIIIRVIVHKFNV
jgi:putative flippase GtrA